MKNYFNSILFSGFVLYSSISMHGMFRTSLHKIGSQRFLTSLAATSLSSAGLASIQSASRAEEQDEHKNEKNSIFTKRPSQVQAEVDSAFENNRCMSGDWMYNGERNSYGLVGLDDNTLLLNFVLGDSQKDVYIIDVGCAKGGWGKNAMEVLQSEACQQSGKRFHIFSVTGSKECDEVKQQNGNVTLYQFNQFKIENIDEEFAKRGFDLRGKVKLIVSNWTLRHLVDPFGTLKRMYALLTTEQGMLMSNGFLFAFDESDEVLSFPKDNEGILANTNTTILFQEFSAGRDVGNFLLMRKDQEDLDIPTYTGRVFGLNPWRRYQCQSDRVTVYNRPNQSFTKERITNRSYGLDHYCGMDDAKCKRLFEELMSKGLFHKDFSDK